MKVDDVEVRHFLNEQLALVVEPSIAFYHVIKNCLTEFGMPEHNILSANTVADAKAIINFKKPKILITEYFVGQQQGLSLVEAMEENYDSLSRISVMVTRQSSDSAIAEAAEEQLDTYIVKPFSSAEFQKRFLEVISRKICPSDYIQKIKLGKEELRRNNIEIAIDYFNQAKSINSKPTLACYYLGECYQRQENFNQALLKFREGRTYSEMHFKCLIGEFECLFVSKKHSEAYTISKMIRNHYPVTASKLGKFCIVAVFTENYDDLRALYENYLQLEARPIELVKIVSNSLMAAGKYTLREKVLSDAVAFFEMVLTVSGRSFEFIDKIVDEFIKSKEYLLAEKFFKHIKSEDMGDHRYMPLKFKVSKNILPIDALIEMGKKMISENQADSETVKFTITQLARKNKDILAESLITKYLENFPDLRKELYQILENKGQ